MGGGGCRERSGSRGGGGGCAATAFQSDFDDGLGGDDAGEDGERVGLEPFEDAADEEEEEEAGADGGERAEEEADEAAAVVVAGAQEAAPEAGYGRGGESEQGCELRTEEVGEDVSEVQPCGGGVGVGGGGDCGDDGAEEEEACDGEEREVCEVEESRQAGGRSAAVCGSEDDHFHADQQFVEAQFGDVEEEDLEDGPMQDEGADEGDEVPGEDQDLGTSPGEEAQAGDGRVRCRRHGVSFVRCGIVLARQSVEPSSGRDSTVETVASAGGVGNGVGVRVSAVAARAGIRFVHAVPLWYRVGPTPGGIARPSNLAGAGAQEGGPG